MKYINDWMVLGLVIGLLCGGLVAGRRLGSLSALWLAGGCWLGFRLADRLWKVVVLDLRADDPQLDLTFWIPVSYGILFVALFVPAAVGLFILRPKKDFVLPGLTEDVVAAAGGGVAACLLVLALVQSHVMHPLAPERIPHTLAATRPVLTGLGQLHVAPGSQPGGPATPTTPATGQAPAVEPGKGRR